MPLLEGLDGVNKMSKSLDNYIGITEAPGEIYGKAMSVSDELMVRYYELLSDVGLETLQAVADGVAGKEGGMHPMEAKKALAHELVARFHSEQAAEEAARQFNSQFQRGQLPEDMPEVVLSGSEPIWICHLLTQAGLTSSNGEARRLVKQGGLKIDGEKVADEQLQVPAEGELIVQAGKRRFAKVVFS